MGEESGANRILIADDSASNRELLRCILARCGFEVVQACDGEEAIQQAFRCCPDLLILDLNMPALDGYEVAERLRKQHEFRSTPILALTADPTFTDSCRLREAGFSMAMEKPIAPTDLRACVASLLQLGVRCRPGYSSNPAA